LCSAFDDGSSGRDANEKAYGMLIEAQKSKLFAIRKQLKEKSTPPTDAAGNRVRIE
jgi:hypothetical protein